ncbi:OLC1v1023685C1 [Oldenlandia corymbosa var. corymbosa]|uniref:OLC1v1023685C1 n=1 Tax=Oldenlandia corymbosa var. corymbosa TaxID=529605 RepID=A0AAV1C0K3_OLDCO|nr:OLC1v1023685C1 [Oldenlandia corymbosa var. corymbosa]
MMRWLSTLGKSFQVRRQMPDLVRPTRPTPREVKLLSDIDDQSGLRSQVPCLYFYKGRENHDGRRNNKEEDPVKVIKAALAETLVPYYPYAGRLREGPGKKLAVDCTGEGVMFIEADADFTLEDFGEEVQPPFPYWEELLHEGPGSTEFLHSPLILIQVTRLRCGGFIFGFRFNHAMSDGTGMGQFTAAMAEIAGGASAPSITPVWRRELLSARDPPRVTCIHREYDDTSTTKLQTNPFGSATDLVDRSVFLSLAKISALRTSLPPHLRLKCSNFDVLTAWLWRCRTTALQLDPEEEVRLMIAVNSRPRFNPPLPRGYYGCAIGLPVALTTAQELIQNPLEYAVDLVMKAKSQVTEEYMKSAADLMVLKGRPKFTVASTFWVSDLRRFQFHELDFGWGKPIYGGPARLRPAMKILSYYTNKTNKAGEEGISVFLCLPKFAMEKLTGEIDRIGR